MTVYQPKLLVTGGNGQLACAMATHPQANSFQLIFCSHKELDISHPDAVQRLLSHHQPDVVINTAAYTKVDQAEYEQEQAMQTNYQGAKALAIACKRQCIPLIHLSTDYVFDGVANIAYTENHAAHPLQVYGYSKYLGEKAIQEHGDNFIILRVSGIFSEYGMNFVKTMFRLLQKKTSLKVVADQFTCPTYANDIAAAIFSLSSQIKQKEILHFCNQPVVSWHQFTLNILEEARIFLPQASWLNRESIEAITSAEYAALAKRPLYSVLNCEKIKGKYDIQATDWQNGLRKTVRYLAENFIKLQ